MKFTGKQASCPNCGYPHGITANFCPSCGQRNASTRLTLGRILLHAIEDIVDVDSRFFRSLRVLATRPGKLTQEYLEGKRMRYVSPFRLFFTVTVVLVFLLRSGWVTDTRDEMPEHATYPPDELFVSRADSQLVLEWYRKYGDSTFSGHSIGAIPPDELKILYSQVPSRELDSVIAASPKGYTSIAERIQYIDYQSFNMGMFGTQFEIRGDEKRIRTVVDSILDDPGPELMAKAGLRITYNIHQHEDRLKDVLVDNISFVILAFMPLFAFVIKLIYIRRPFLYIDHFIFTIHQHTWLALSSLGFALWEMLPLSDLDTWTGELMLVIYLIINYIYLIMAMRNVYGQGWLKTIVKTAMLQFLYVLLSSVFLATAFLAIALVA